eukprot:5177515-Pyramimonas_sp.AAC.1
MEPSAVVLPPERCKFLVDEVVSLDYYKQQKVWVEQVMKSSALKQTSAVITKSTVLRKVMTSIEKLEKAISAALPASSPEAQEAMAPQFYQLNGQSHRMATISDYGLVECKLCLEGNEMMYGIPSSMVPGATHADKQRILGQMAMREWLKIVEEHGFSYRMAPGVCLVIPARFATFTVNASDDSSHGLRWLIHGNAFHAKAAVQYLDEAIAQKPEIAQGRVGFIKTFLDQYLDESRPEGHQGQGTPVSGTATPVAPAQPDGS